MRFKFDTNIFVCYVLTRRYVTEPENNDWWEEAAEENNEVTENGGRY